MMKIVETIWKSRAVLQYRMKQWVGSRPRLYHALFQRRSGYQGLLVSESTDICIDGFPRSANSFAVGAFSSANPDVDIAHHTHVPAQILRACEYEIPTVVLARHPIDAIVSGRGLELQIAAINDRKAPLRISFSERLKAWVAFYECVLPYRERVIIAPFDTVIHDFGCVIDAVNRRYGVDFAPFHHTESNVDSIRSNRGYHALPSDKRETLKQLARQRCTEELSHHHALVEQANGLFEALVEDTSVRIS